MSAFPARDKRIVALYESGALTQAQIGEMFGISQSRVQQICRARARVDGCKRRVAWLRVNHRAGRMNRFGWGR